MNTHKFCNRKCTNYHVQPREGNRGGVVEFCFLVRDEKKWRITRLDSMVECPGRAKK